MKWYIEKRKVNVLIPFPRNPRQMTEKQVKDLKTSLEKFNLVEIPAINTDNMIIAGHQRLKILQLLGRGNEEIDVRIPDRKLTPKEVEEYCIRSNKNTGEFNFEDLANSFDHQDLLNFGFTEAELVGPEDTQLPDSEPNEKSKVVKCPHCGETFEIDKENFV